MNTFLTGIKTNLGPNGSVLNLNQPANVVASEMLRLNTAVAAVPYARQNRLGVLGSLLTDGGADLAGYPNGRRPKDDIVDISLVAMMGGLCRANTGNALGFGAACNPSVVPLGDTVFKLHDAVDQAVVPLLPGFPYLNTPNPGAK